MIKALIACVLLFAAETAVTSAATGELNLTGEIMDSQCGLAGTHEMMKKQIGAQDDAECTRACVKQGGKLVLYDSSTKKVYQLQNQQKAMDYAGQKVKVAGTQTQDNVVQIETIQPISQ